MNDRVGDCIGIGTVSRPCILPFGAPKVAGRTSGSSGAVFNGVNPSRLLHGLQIAVGLLDPAQRFVLARPDTDRQRANRLVNLKSPIELIE